jgi:multisubunit Na+/H+ antiporter MnhC subunit
VNLFTRVIMVAIVIGLALVAIFANIQRVRREKIETVIVTPAESPAGASH